MPSPPQAGPFPAHAGPPALRWRSYLGDGLLLYALTAVLIWPLFGALYFDNWGSIESSFMAHARFLVDHWPHPQWQPLWYCGTRFDYIYPPALPYGTAILSKIFPLPIPQAYHVYVALFYCLGVAGLYALVRSLSGSRVMAWGAAILHALVSPSFLFLELVRGDAAQRYLCPQRLNVLVYWGEGPHISALAVVPVALAFAYWALTRTNLCALGASATLCALCVSNNFYGAVTLAMLYPLLVWSVWVTTQKHDVWVWAGTIPALAYGLTAVWLVPSYLRETTANLAMVQASGEGSHAALMAASLVVFLVVSYVFGRFRRDLTYSIFVAGATLIFALPVLGDEWFGLRVFGSAIRFVPELDIVLTLAWLELCRRLASGAAIGWPSHERFWRYAAVGLALAPLASSYNYIANAWKIYIEDPSYEERVEYRIPQWVSENLPEARVYSEDSIRFWFNVWQDLPQLTGGSHQGMLNQNLGAAEWNLRVRSEGEWAIEWMQAFGVSAAVVSDETSPANLGTLVHPGKLDGLLPVLHRNGLGEAIYEVPRRFLARARVVEEAVVRELPPITEGWQRDHLQAYVRAVEEGPDSPVSLEWLGPETMLVRLSLEPGQLLLIQESYDPSWHAYSGETEFEVREDVLGQMLVLAPPGQHELLMQFELPLENLLGRIISAAAAFFVLVLLFSGAKGRQANRSS